MNILELCSIFFLVAGAIFFLAGTIGVLRFPDVYTRLHALAKVDNLGLGFTSIGLLFQAPGLIIALKIILIWLLALVASSTLSFLIARRAMKRRVIPWRAREHTI
ncbi:MULTISPECIES: cation:proton antiporter [Nitrosomonas]|uniref:Cation:proton antiporter n=1 Tax=Nitrosomonas communis TaxID=44574 RepID=A0A0F7KAW9_9PROT|nr:MULTISPECIES: monovalent cation/H(+) antiporter subunit G [Nitrosomonas]AKH36731.1 cation:proton antiporter [Nitrosomonas communis]TYP73011.1 multicomponent Na+:H+ antiporter subunit G [Nitrosomonas communis]UVS61805.1 monovalent cation/H(+) antiporter subunit G [Nitrosomonas sp. PLL12]